jgi:hypothetical protein
MTISSAPLHYPRAAFLNVRAIEAIELAKRQVDLAIRSSSRGKTSQALRIVHQYMNKAICSILDADGDVDLHYVDACERLVEIIKDDHRLSGHLQLALEFMKAALNAYEETYLLLMQLEEGDQGVLR